MSEFNIKQGTDETFRAVVTDDGSARDLTGCTCLLRFGTAGEIVFSETLTDEGSGIVSYAFTDAQTDLYRGKYLLEVVVTDADGDVTIYPKSGQETIVFHRRIGGLA